MIYDDCYIVLVVADDSTDRNELDARKNVVRHCCRTKGAEKMSSLLLSLYANLTELFRKGLYNIAQGRGG